MIGAIVAFFDDYQVAVASEDPVGGEDGEDDDVYPFLAAFFFIDKS